MFYKLTMLLLPAADETNVSDLHGPLPNGHSSSHLLLSTVMRHSDCVQIMHLSCNVTLLMSDNFFLEYIMRWYIEVLKKYLEFKGRASRSEYWFFVAIHIAISFVLGIIDNMLGLVLSGGLGIVGGVYLIAVLAPALGVTIRRLHDTGRSGWWLLLSLIPLIGPIVLIIFLVQGSKPGENNFGPYPTLDTV